MSRVLLDHEILSGTKAKHSGRIHYWLTSRKGHYKRLGIRASIKAVERTIRVDGIAFPVVVLIATQALGKTDAPPNDTPA